MFRLLLTSGGEASAPKSLMRKLSLFQNEPELLNRGSYTVKSAVTRNVLDFFMTRFYGEKSSETVTKENAEQLRALCDELGFSGFDDEIHAVLGASKSRDRQEVMALRDRVDRQEVLLEQLQRKVLDLERQLESYRSQVSEQFGVVEKKLEETGMALVNAGDLKSLAADVSHLKETEKSWIRMQSGKEFVYDSSHPLDGIIAHLTWECGGNVHYKEVVEARAAGFWCGSDSDDDPAAVVDFDRVTYFCPRKYPRRYEGNLCFWYNFKERQVIPTSYTIKCPSSYRTEALMLEFGVSNDGDTIGILGSSP